MRPRAGGWIWDGSMVGSTLRPHTTRVAPPCPEPSAPPAHPTPRVDPTRLPIPALRMYAIEKHTHTYSEPEAAAAVVVVVVRVVSAIFPLCSVVGSRLVTGLKPPACLLPVRRPFVWVLDLVWVRASVSVRMSVAIDPGRQRHTRFGRKVRSIPKEQEETQMARPATRANVRVGDRPDRKARIPPQRGPKWRRAAACGDSRGILLSIREATEGGGRPDTRMGQPLLELPLEKIGTFGGVVCFDRDVRGFGSVRPPRMVVGFLEGARRLLRFEQGELLRVTPREAEAEEESGGVAN